MHQIDLSGVSFRTDLAREAHELALKRRGDQSNIPGVRIHEEAQDGIQTSWIWIDDDAAGKEMNKIPGTYLTLEVPQLRSHDSMLEKRVAEHFATELQKFFDEIGIGINDRALIVGLGNWDVTPDALGPLIVKHTLVTRHLFKLAPDSVAEGYRSVSAISPGVLGITGIETSEIVQGVVEKSRPDFLIAFDSLASRSLARVNTTIQVADTGIHPGSGVGNRRKALNQETLGIPVIAIGVPTVVDAATIAHDTIDFVLAHLNRELKGERSNPLDPWNRATVQDLQTQEVSEKTRNQLLGIVGSLSSKEKRELIEEVLMPLGQNLIVTPKEVDSFIAGIAKLIANALNCALHEAVTMDNLSAHIH